jgi:2-desacetyl-2-hydroxyethyl bacteriochlorophyllide A dehydrogenase
VQQIRVHGPDDVRLDDVVEAEPGPRDAVVRVAACGICGTDLSYIRMGGLGGSEPMALGHEMAGVVDRVGDDVRQWKPGDRVIVYPGNDELGRIGNGTSEGGLSPRLLVREVAGGGRLYRVPDDMPLRIAALAEPLGVGMQAVNQAAVEAGDKVAVFGCGPVGLFAIATLADRGVEQVVAIDLSRRRRELARALGAHAALDPGEVDVWAELARLHGTVPFMFGPAPATDAFIEASGSPRVLTDIIDRSRPGGRMSVVAVHFTPIPTNYAVVLMKELTIRGSFEYPPRFEDAIELLARRDLSGVVTHALPLEEFDAALALLQGSKDCGKVLITIGDDR